MSSSGEIPAVPTETADPFALRDEDLSDVLGSGPRELTPAEQLGEELAATHQAEACVALASRAEELGDADLRRRCLEQAIALDRNCQAALLMLAAQTLEDGDAATTFALLEETARAGLLPDDVVPLHQQLAEQAATEPSLEPYLRLTGRVGEERATATRSILVLTNLFPPQELGGYGRMMWEFAWGLQARGHDVRVLSGDVTSLAKSPTADEAALEPRVARTLELLGTWEGGRAVGCRDRAEAGRRERANAKRIRAEISARRPDLVLAGNLDFLGASCLAPILEAGVPVLHALANAAPGYVAADQPRSPLYWVGPCSQWNGEVFRQAGYAPARVETLYPGARVDRFFRLFQPDTRRLRICYASIVLPYKGADTLVDALIRLHDAGIEFTAEIAGESPDPAFVAGLQAKLATRGLEEKVRFTGFLDRVALSALFARSNVLVFPSRFQEPFGISQMEALAAGLVVVTSGTGGAKEIIRDQVDGLAFPAGDDAALAGRLLALARNPAAMAQLQRAGQARAQAFSVSRAVVKIEQLAGEMAPRPASVKPAETLARPAESLAELEAAVARAPDDRPRQRQLALALKRAGRIAESLSWFRRSAGGPARLDVGAAADRARVAFLVQYAPGWTSLASVWRELSQDPNFEVTVIACPFQHDSTKPGEAEAIYGFLTEAGVPFVRWTDADLRPGFADILFVQIPYDNTRPAALRVPALLRIVPRLAYVPYGLEVGAGALNLGFQYNLPLQQAAWRIFARSERQRAAFARHCAAGAAHVEVTGHPRLDAARAPEAGRGAAELRAFAAGRPLVFWNPHFDVKPDGTGYSTFLAWEAEIVAEFARRSDLALVIRPHPLFFGALEQRGIWTAAQIADFQARVAASGNIQIDRRASYLPLFAAADAMISDASTFLLEFAATGKPFRYFANPRGPQLNADGQAVVAAAGTLREPADLRGFLDAVARREDPAAEGRRKALAEILYAPAGTVAGEIRERLWTAWKAERAEAKG